MEQINGANLLAFCSLAQQAEDSAIAAQINMKALVKHYTTLQTKNVKLRAAIVGLLRFHQEGDDGAELPREYWSPGYREAVEAAEALVGSNDPNSGAARGPIAGGPLE